MESFDFCLTFSVNVEKKYRVKSKDGRYAEISVLKHHNQTCVLFKLSEVIGVEKYEMEVHGIGQKVSLTKLLSYTTGTACQFNAAGYERCTVKCAARLPTTADKFIVDIVEKCRQDPQLLMTFQCQDAKVQGIASLMKMMSPVIRDLLQSHSIAALTKTVDTTEFSAAAVKKLVEYCETNAIRDTSGFEVDLYKLANMFQVTRMADLARNLLTPIICLNTADEISALARLYKDSVLMDNVIKYFCQFSFA